MVSDSQADNHGIVSCEGQGFFRSKMAILYTSSAVIVANPSAAFKREADPAETAMPTDPELRRKLNIMHARSRMNNDEDVTGNTLSSINLDPPSATVVADAKSSSPAASLNRKPFSSVASPNDNDDGDDKSPAAANSVPASTATAAPSGSSPPSAADLKTSAPANVGNNPASGMSKADFFMDKARESRDVGSAVNVGGEKGGDGGRGPSTVPQQIRGLEFHPDFALKVGQVLLGRLPNPARTSIAYASPTDGSVILATAIGKAPRDADGNTTGPVPQKNRTLLTANPRKMSKVRARQSENIVARLEKKRAALEGRTLRKHGFLRRRAREQAEAHMGEATLFITKKGGLEVSVDGIVVLRMSGLSWFVFRRTDLSYELRVAEEGVVIFRRGMYDWGIKAWGP
ncbi:unnamed protein product [Ectocarpus sp. CCAP 1310/34]|nr:unnamed protein product [Ectocarpus sp. CCAP 1310/34]